MNLLCKDKGTDLLSIFYCMKYTFNDLVDIMARLRSENGCPWDRKQDTHSLLPYLVEESCEFIDAAQEGDKEHMCEELGDVLFQVIFHSQVMKEQGDFSIDDVVQACAKRWCAGIRMCLVMPKLIMQVKSAAAGNVSRPKRRTT